MCNGQRLAVARPGREPNKPSAYKSRSIMAISSTCSGTNAVRLRSNGATVARFLALVDTTVL